MFDAVCVSQRTRKPWTVAVSATGQMAIVGLAVLVPLIGTQALPRRSWFVSVPEPPHALPRHETQAPVKRVRPAPVMANLNIVTAPAVVPDHIVILQELKDAPTADGPGVPGGIDGSPGPGNAVIDTLLRSRPAPPPPPVPAAKSAPPPAPTQRIKLGGRVVEGKLIFAPRPVYPPVAKAARISGVVRLQAVISRAGTIMDLRAVSGPALLIGAAIEAVKQWVYRPTLLNGDPVEVATEIEVNFTLQP